MMTKTKPKKQCGSPITDGNKDKKNDFITFFCVRDNGHKGKHEGDMIVSRKSGKVVKRVSFWW